MAPDESFKRPGSIPFKWEVQPGIPKKQETAGRGATATPVPLPPTTTPRLAPPPAARATSKLASASCRRSSVSSLPTPPSASHRRSMSARFATSLVLLPLSFTRKGRGSKDDAADDFCLVYGDKIA